MSKIYETIEFLGLTVIPASYCQLTRIVSLVAILAFAFNGDAHDADQFGEVWRNVSRALSRVLLTLIFAFIILSVDHVAAEMETPFGGRDNDVDIQKIVRRTDRHTAALCSCWGGHHEDYDLFPTTRRAERRRQWWLQHRVSERMRRYSSSTEWEKTGGLSLCAECTSNREGARRPLPHPTPPPPTPGQVRNDEAPSRVEETEECKGSQRCQPRGDRRYAHTAGAIGGGERRRG